MVLFKVIRIRNTEAAGTFLKLRTILQKEGNKYPQIVIDSTTVEGDELSFTWDLSRGQEGLIRYSVKYADGNGPSFNLQDGEDSRQAALRTLPQLFVDTLRLVKQTREFNQTFCIGDEYQRISKEKIMELCLINLDAAAEIVHEAEERFGVPTY